LFCCIICRLLMARAVLDGCIRRHRRKALARLGFVFGCVIVVSLWSIRLDDVWIIPSFGPAESSGTSPRLPRVARAANGEDDIGFENEDWRDFRAKLVLKDKREKMGAANGTEKEGWAYQTDLLEQGSLILSTPGDYWSIRRQYFGKVVMLIINHDQRGTMGVVLNRPTNLTTQDIDLSEEDLPQDKLFKMIGLSNGSEEWKIWFGGDCEGLELDQTPESPRHICLHAKESLAEESRRVIKGVYFTDLATARQIVARGGARKDDFLLVVGYTGWAPGQLQGELDRGDAWILGAADTGLLLGDDGDQEPSLGERMGIACAPRSADGRIVPISKDCLGDGIHHWNRLYAAVRPEAFAALNEEAEALNDEMIRRWINQYLARPVQPTASSSKDEGEAPLVKGSIWRGSATKWLLGRPDASWPSRQRVDPWMVPGTYFHKSVFVLLQDTPPSKPAVVVLLNGPRIGEFMDKRPVFFGGVHKCDGSTILPLPEGGGIAGKLILPPGTLQELMQSDAVSAAEDVSLEEILDVDCESRWQAAGGKLETISEVITSTQGDKQRKKWFRSIMGLKLDPDE